MRRCGLVAAGTGCGRALTRSRRAKHAGQPLRGAIRARQGGRPAWCDYRGVAAGGIVVWCRGPARRSTDRRAAASGVELSWTFGDHSCIFDELGRLCVGRRSAEVARSATAGPRAGSSPLPVLRTAADSAAAISSFRTAPTSSPDAQRAHVPVSAAHELTVPTSKKALSAGRGARPDNYRERACACVCDLNPAYPSRRTRGGSSYLRAPCRSGAAARCTGPQLVWPPPHPHPTAPPTLFFPAPLSDAACTHVAARLPSAHPEEAPPRPHGRPRYGVAAPRTDGDGRGGYFGHGHGAGGFASAGLA